MPQLLGGSAARCAPSSRSHGCRLLHCCARLARRRAEQHRGRHACIIGKTDLTVVCIDWAGHNMSPSHHAVNRHRSRGDSDDAARSRNESFTPAAPVGRLPSSVAAGGCLLDGCRAGAAACSSTSLLLQNGAQSISTFHIKLEVRSTPALKCKNNVTCQCPKLSCSNHLSSSLSLGVSTAWPAASFRLALRRFRRCEPPASTAAAIAACGGPSGGAARSDAL